MSDVSARILARISVSVSVSVSASWNSSFIDMTMDVNQAESRRGRGESPQNFEVSGEALIKLLQSDFFHVSKLQAPDCLHYNEV